MTKLRAGRSLLLLLALIASSCSSAGDGSTAAAGSADTAAPAETESTTTSAAESSSSEPVVAQNPLVDLDFVRDDANDFVLIDARTTDQFAEGHITGAFSLPADGLNDPDQDAQVSYQLGPDEHAAQVLGELGVEPDDTVVIYDDFSSLYAARVFYGMRFYGHADVRLFDGGLLVWNEAGLELSTDIPATYGGTYPTTSSDAVRLELGDVGAALDAGDATFVDARAAAEYVGDQTFADEAGGHIPGAVNVDWSDTVGPDGRFLDVETLRGLYGIAGVDGDDPLVAYCYIGVRAAHSWFVLTELLGFTDVGLYDGSWSDYGTTSDVKIER